MDQSPEEKFDLIVVGAGINGTGICRDAALRGLKVLLVDKGDISSGTSGWSSRLIHGGLRYLEHGEIGLVRESLREREILLRIAPHRVKPLRLIIPVYRRSKRGLLTLRAGMVAYDLLSIGKSLPCHKMLNRQAALELAPGLDPLGLMGAATYSDAQAEFAERLAVENVLSAVERGAAVRTYARVDRIVLDGGQVSGVEFTDVLTKSRHAAFAPIVINVAGPWIDDVLAGLSPRPERMISGTKGSHIIVSRFAGAPADALYAEARADGRPFFIIPWNGLILIGTTDLRYDGDLDKVQATSQEVQYLIEETNHVIPSAGLNSASILYTYSGVRPLPFSVGGPESAIGAEGAITRRHMIRDHSKGDPRLGGLISIAGGKLTTFRNLARQAVDLIFDKLGRRRAECLTGKLALPGGSASDFQQFSIAFKAEHNLPERTANHLLRVYGVRALGVMSIAGNDASLRKPFSEDTGAIGAEVLLAFQMEKARTLTDVMLRRTMAGLGPDAGIGSDERAARVCRDYLGWDEMKEREEVRNYRDYVRRYRSNLPGGDPGR